jgi:hypothetical protein
MSFLKNQLVTTSDLSQESDRKLVDAWLRAKTPRPSTAQSDAVPSWDETTDLNHDVSYPNHLGEGILIVLDAFKRTNFTYLNV